MDELIERLKNYHGSTPVLVDGYEDGYDLIGFRLARVTRRENEDDEWWSGIYQPNEESGIEVLVLTR